MGLLDKLIFEKEVTVEDKGDYVIICLGGLPYRIPKETYKKMEKSK